jgi:membrane fusion protein (multidrug efflux system)
MTRAGRFASLAVLALAVAAVAVPRLLSTRSEPAAGPPGPAANPAAEAGAAAAPRLPVTVHTVASAPLVERLSTTGTLRANEQIEVVSEIAGQVEAVRFQEGSPVAAGEVLVALDASELGAQRERATHRVELARRREARQRQLRDDGLISDQEYDSVRTELDVLRAELALVEAQLEKTAIRAPFEGVVGLRYVSPGAHVTPETRIASLQDLDPMKVDFSVPERYADRIRTGRRVELAVAGVEERFAAEVYAVEPAVEASTRSLIVRARLANPGRRLRPGAFADVAVVVTEVPDALAVPSVAVVPELGGKKVFVVEDGVAVARPVETGIRTDVAVEVTSGLAPGDRVIVGGLERVKAGDPVEAREAG